MLNVVYEVTFFASLLHLQHRQHAGICKNFVPPESWEMPHTQAERNDHKHAITIMTHMHTITRSMFIVYA